MEESLLSIVKQNLRVKASYIEGDARADGNKADSSLIVINMANEILSSFQIIHSEWVDTQWQALSKYFSRVTFEEIEQSFRQALENRILMDHRFTKDNNPEDLYKFEDENYLVGHIIGAAFNFITTIRAGKRLGLSASSSLEIAKLSFYNDSDELRDLVLNNRHLPNWVLVHAATHSSKNPQEFIDNVIETADNLSQKYSDSEVNIPGWVFLRAAVTYNRTSETPDEYIDEVISIFNNLRNLYPNTSDVPDSVILYAAVNNTRSPQKYIERYLKGETNYRKKK